MPRIFHRTLTFNVEGEIYDNETKAEDLLKHYDFNFKDYNDGIDKAFIIIEHKDHRGRITKIHNRPLIAKAKKPDSEYFLI